VLGGVVPAFLAVAGTALPGVPSLQAQEKKPEARPAVPAPIPPPVFQPVPGQPAVGTLPAAALATGKVRLVGGLRVLSAARRFHFTIAPDTPLQDLLPAAPKARHAAGPLLGDDLAQVPEVLFQENLPAGLPADKALERTAHQVAKINFLNQKEGDGFLRALLQRRPDLAGLPFAMGDACRTKGERSRQFKLALATVRQALQQAQVPARINVNEVTTVRRAVRQAVTRLRATQAAPKPDGPPPPAPAPHGPAKPPAPPQPASSDSATHFVDVVMLEALEGGNQAGTAGEHDAATFWEKYRGASAREDKDDLRKDRAHREQVTLARIAALMQVLAPEPPGMRLGLVSYLATVSHPEATRALARLAIFAPEDEVRRAAVDALKVRRERDYTEILLEGLRYPLPAVARRAGAAVVQLERTDLVPQLVALLEEPDPRAPVVKTVKGHKAPVVRELVRLNHHRSCLVCHAPGNTATVSPDAVVAQVPTPGTPLSSPSEGYQNSVPEVTVRVDVTYLRQDFSARLPVADAHPWPELQRFDFLVRSRVLTEDEARAYRAKLTRDEPGFVTPYQRAVLAALRELTGRDTEPTAAAWRRLLNL
jgi:hypothetical protein